MNKELNESHNKLKFSKNEVYAYNKGYRVTKDGVFCGLKNNIIINYNKAGYNRVCTKKDKKQISVFAHSLQAYQKYGDKIYESGILVRHLDGNSKNNHIDNIALGTNTDNMMDRPKIERKRQALKASLKTKKYNTDEVKKYYIENGFSYKETQKYFGISSSGTLHYILNKTKR